jgi:hypothetical protein
MYNLDRPWRVHWPVEVAAIARSLDLDTREIDAMLAAAGTSRIRRLGGGLEAVGVTRSGRKLWLSVEVHPQDGILEMRGVVELSAEDRPE